MRGKVSHSTNGGFQIRITPAYAGKRPYTCARESSQTHHPRLCGEKAKYGISEDALKGSPPPMRGKEFFAVVGTVKGWITPAYAGKSLYACNRQ